MNIVLTKNLKQKKKTTYITIKQQKHNNKNQNNMFKKDYFTV